MNRIKQVMMGAVACLLAGYLISIPMIGHAQPVTGGNTGASPVTGSTGTFSGAMTASSFTATATPASFALTMSGTDPYIYGSNTNSNVTFVTAVSAAEAGSTCGTSMLCIRPQGALDANDYVLSVGDAAATSMFSVSYTGDVSANVGRLHSRNAGGGISIGTAGSAVIDVQAGASEITIGGKFQNAQGYLQAGAGSGNGESFYLGGTMLANVTGVGNVGASAPDDLQTFTLDANTLNIAQRCLKITAWGTTANTAAAKTVRLTIGPTPTALVTKALAASIAGSWNIEALVCRTGASTQDYKATAWNNNGTALCATSACADGATIERQFAVGTLTQTETNALVIKTQSTVSTNDNDIVSEGLVVEYF
jgi:hypothetical protein